MPRTRSSAPATADDLLDQLARARLLDGGQRSRLGHGFGGIDAADAAERLVAAGLLTPFQARLALAGRARRLLLGPYRLLDRLGEGSGGKVYKAEHVLMKRLVTLKVFGKGVGRPADEVAAAAKLSHPNLAAAFHAGRVRGRLVLALEYVEGVDLDCFLAQTGPLPVGLAREVVRQTARALAYLHGCGLLHLDVKPANVLLAYEGERPVVKLIDLGLSRPVGDGGGCEGTVDYLAPERGEGAGDVRSDLYALGCTAYQLLCGEVPFPGGTWTEKLVRHSTEEPTPLRSLRPDVPPRLAAAVARMMRRDPEGRYPDADALLADLDEPPRPAPAPRARPRTSWGALAARVLIAVAMGMAVGGLGKIILAASAPSAAPTAVRNVIVVEGRDAEHLDLQKAIDDAPDGGVVTLTGPGPYRVAPVRIAGKSLTVRAAEGKRARVVREAGGSAWDALLWADRDLCLVGLDLAGDDVAAPLACVEGGSLRAEDCSLRAPGKGPAVALRKGPSLRLERVRLDAADQGVAVEVGRSAASVALRGCELRVRGVAGPAVLLWSAERGEGPVSVEMRGGEIDAGRVLALSGLGGRVEADVDSTRLGFVQAMASIDGCGGDWRRHLGWRARAAAYAGHGPHVRHEGRPAVWDEGGWRE